MTLQAAIEEAIKLARRTKITAYIHRHTNPRHDHYNLRFGAPVETVDDNYITVAIVWPDGRLFTAKPQSEREV